MYMCKYVCALMCVLHVESQRKLVNVWLCHILSYCLEMLSVTEGGVCPTCLVFCLSILRLQSCTMCPAFLDIKENWILVLMLSKQVFFHTKLLSQTDYNDFGSLLILFWLMCTTICIMDCYVLLWCVYNVAWLNLAYASLCLLTVGITPKHLQITAVI